MKPMLNGCVVAVYKEAADAVTAIYWLREFRKHCPNPYCIKADYLLKESSESFHTFKDWESQNIRALCIKDEKGTSVLGILSSFNDLSTDTAIESIHFVEKSKVCYVFRTPLDAALCAFCISHDHDFQIDVHSELYHVQGLKGNGICLFCSIEPTQYPTNSYPEGLLEETKPGCSNYGITNLRQLYEDVYYQMKCGFDRFLPEECEYHLKGITYHFPGDVPLTLICGDITSSLYIVINEPKSDTFYAFDGRLHFTLEHHLGVNKVETDEAKWVSFFFLNICLSRIKEEYKIKVDIRNMNHVFPMMYPQFFTSNPWNFYFGSPVITLNEKCNILSENNYVTFCNNDNPEVILRLTYDDLDYDDVDEDKEKPYIYKIPVIVHPEHTLLDMLQLFSLMHKSSTIWGDFL